MENMEEEKKEINIDDLQNKLDECEKLKEEYLAGWQRARADFLNHKKEEMERFAGLMQYATEELVLKFLPILDNFNIIEKEVPEELKKDKNIEGLLLIKKQILDFLKVLGVEEIKAMGEKLDLNCHEAVGEAENTDQEPETIVEEIQKGYRIKDRLLRATKVRVSK